MSNALENMTREQLQTLVLEQQKKFQIASRKNDQLEKQIQVKDQEIQVKEQEIQAISE